MEYKVNSWQELKELTHKIEFVYASKNQRPLIIDEKEIEKIKALDLLKYVYAGIWTDKGLIYVAKMNDKGEFELL